MRAFLEESIEKIQSEYSDISKLIIVLPSKRAGGFLKNYLRKQTSTPFFAPQIISIEEFIQELANLKIISSEELLLKCYKAYSSITEIENKETFENFTAWATTLLNDFNEIDRYLIDPKSFFSYLSSIKTLEKWGAEKEQTPLIDDFLKFWNHIHLIYDNLNHELLSEGNGYQGMVYRKASEDIEHYLHNKGNLTHIFIGFNALNKAEEHIIQELLEVGNSQIFWDIDAYFYNDPEHSSSIFIRNYLQHWKYYDTQSTPTFSEIYQRPKTIQIVEAQNNIQQAKYLGALLESLSEETLDETAIVLADESLLMPVLYSLPSNVKSANITMGAPLESFNIVHFFNTLFKLQLKKGSYYYSNVAALLNHPFSDILLKSAKHILSEMNRLNISHISAKKIKSLAPEEEKGILELLFDPWNQQSTQALQSCLKLIELAQIEELSSQAEKIALRKLEGLFLKIQTLIERNDYLKELVSFQSLFAQLIAQDSLDFEGDAYDGLQIMGVLETRVLDFKNVIFLSVNEGFLPAGRSNASYITSDLKKQFELPFYTEKDAIYAYHFYRLMQRAENITLLYNGQGKGLSASEKSRFIMQIEVDNLKQHQISHKSLSASFEARESGPREIEKSDKVLIRLKEIAEKGFSPSALTSYIRNPLDFYYQKILRVKEADDLEETVDYSTLGTVVHNTLENLYKPYEGSYLKKELLQSFKKKVDKEVLIQFEECYKEGTIDKGKNLIIFEVAKRYVTNLINLDIKEINQGNSIKLLHVEIELKANLDITEIDFPVSIGGKVDRIDMINEQLRIVDYKTGNVTQGDLEIVDWDILTQDYKYSKAFQVLAYSLMCQSELKYNSMEAGIISFRNLGSGFLKFAKKDAPRSKTKQTDVSEDILNSFKQQLISLISEICDPDVPFIEKEL